MDRKLSFGVIGGSGLEQMSGLKNVYEHKVEETPFGQPSGPVVVGEIEGVNIAFLARHGEGHHISPSEVNFRANIYALKSMGVERVVGVSACGSLREDYAPGEIVIPDQIFDFTKSRKNSFFEEGIVVHVSVAEPFCPDLSATLYKSVLDTGARVHQGGSFLTIEGPRFSTRLESNVYRSWNMSLVGMTISPEAFLAREAEMCYSVMGLVTDYDVWHDREGKVSFDKIVEIMNKNRTVALEAIHNLSLQIKAERPCDCSKALAGAIATQPELIDRATYARLSLLLSKYLKRDS